MMYKKLDPNVPSPKYGSLYASGFDLYAAIDGPLTIYANYIMKVPSGISLQFPDRYLEGQVRSRSGLAIKHGIAVVNAPGTIDYDYTGEIIVGLINLSNNAYVIQPYEKIAQLVVAPVYRCALIETQKEFKKTERGSNGLGSTGRF